jgi:hypothetical protein
MQGLDVLLPLAGSLSQCDWTEAGIEAHLRQRLPRTWYRIPALITRTLLVAFPGQTAPDPGRITQALRASAHAARLLAHARKSHSLPAPWLESPVFRPIPALAGLPLPRLTSPDELADGSPSHTTRSSASPIRTASLPATPSISPGTITVT